MTKKCAEVEVEKDLMASDDFVCICLAHKELPSLPTRPEPLPPGLVRPVAAANLWVTSILQARRAGSPGEVVAERPVQLWSV